MHSSIPAKFVSTILALSALLQPIPTCQASTEISLQESAALQPAESTTPEEALVEAGSSSEKTTENKLAANDPSQDTGVSTLNGQIDATDPTSVINQVDELTKQVLLKIIELQRFNLHYNLEVAKQGRWKGWRYSFFNESNAGLGLAGAIIGTAERGSHIYSPDKVHNAMQQNACFIPMIGSIIGAGAAGLELTINEYHDIRARQKGFAPATARNYVGNLKNQINELLVKRETLLKMETAYPSLQGRIQIDQLEGKVLKDLRDQSLVEFEKFQVGARRLLAFQQSQYMFDFSKNVTNAIGYEFAFLSLHRRRRFWNYSAGVLFLVSGGLYMGGPVASRVFGKVVGDIHKRRLESIVGDAESTHIAALQADNAALEELCKRSSCSPESIQAPLDRLALYGLHEKTFENQLSKSKKQQSQAKLTATQNIGAATYVGGTKVASGVLFTVPGYYHRYNSKSKSSARTTNDLLFVSSIISLPASLFAMLDTLRIQVRGELNRHNQLKAGVHPSQLVKARLTQLDDMERKLKATSTK